jgi:large subunit ribosomal protein L15
VLKGESHPIISLQADAALIEQGALYKAPQGILAPGVVESLKAAQANPDTPVEVKHAALRAVMAQVGQRYAYRLPDATARKDIEYYRDPAPHGQGRREPEFVLQDAG